MKHAVVLPSFIGSARHLLEAGLLRVVAGQRCRGPGAMRPLELAQRLVVAWLIVLDGINRCGRNDRRRQSPDDSALGLS